MGGRLSKNFKLYHLMIYLFADEKNIVQKISGFDKILLGLDFDGTLTPIVSHPDEVAFSLRQKSILQQNLLASPA